MLGAGVGTSVLTLCSESGTGKKPHLFMPPTPGSQEEMRGDGTVAARLLPQWTGQQKLNQEPLPTKAQKPAASEPI